MGPAKLNDVSERSPKEGRPFRINKACSCAPGRTRINNSCNASAPQCVAAHAGAQSAASQPGQSDSSESQVAVTEPVLAMPEIAAVETVGLSYIKRRNERAVQAMRALI